MPDIDLAITAIELELRRRLRPRLFFALKLLAATAAGLLLGLGLYAFSCLSQGQSALSYGVK